MHLKRTSRAGSAGKQGYLLIDVCEVVFELRSLYLLTRNATRVATAAFPKITIAQNLETTILVLLTKIVASAA